MTAGITGIKPTNTAKTKNIVSLLLLTILDWSLQNVFDAE